MLKKINKKRFVLYLWFGALYTFLWMMFDITQTDDHLWARLVNNIWRSIYIVVINFIFFEYSIPYVKRRKSRLIMGILLLFFFWIQLMLYSFGLYAWRGIGILLHIYTPLITFKSVMAGVDYGVPAAISSLFIFGFCRHIYDHYKLKESAKQLKIEKQQAELNYLKSQTNPHFLFNTLNNIYSLSRAKSDQAPEAILRLSKMLRYMLYETGGDYIAIEQELKIISDYIELEKLRYDETLRINFNYDVENMKQALPPLLLIPLVENAFKHGVSETRGDAFVDIHLSVRTRQLGFVVKNSTDLSDAGNVIRENIGLSNLRRQLQLLYTEYDLAVQQSNTSFTAILKINLATHV